MICILTTVLTLLIKHFFKNLKWFNQGFGQITESAGGDYVTASIYNNLTGISCMKLPEEARNSKNS